jgi:hypothetical protein
MDEVYGHQTSLPQDTMVGQLSATNRTQIKISQGLPFVTLHSTQFRFGSC